MDRAHGLAVAPLRADSFLSDPERPVEHLITRVAEFELLRPETDHGFCDAPQVA